jgi:DNA-binding NtrC family response regulator
MMKVERGKPIEVLVIEDNHDDLSLIQQLLDKAKGTSFHINPADRLSTGFKLLDNGHFDLIFLDLLMPELDGAELFRRIRQMDKDTPVVIITGYPDSEVMKRAMEHGPFIILRKPFTCDDILGVVHSFVT